jgi:hypothetical protein
MQKIRSSKKKSSKRNQNPSRYYNSITKKYDLQKKNPLKETKILQDIITL